MQRRLMVSFVVLAAMSSFVLAEGLATDFGAAVRTFSAARHKLARELSSQLNLPFPEAAEQFFRSAETGNWESVSNQFKQVWGQHGSAIPELRNELWAPIQETLGIWEVWAGWKEDSALLAMFYEPVLESMPKGSIYFGGTDYGRFVITTANALRKPPKIFCITQNALADNTYAAHLRAVYGDRIWLPQNKNCADAFQRYVEEVRSGDRPKNAQLEIVNGQVTVSGALGVMEINGIICEMIFAHNKDTHQFYVEESYVLDWMYPYLEPCGLIMKLNPQPSAKLSAESVTRDSEFWKRYESLLESQPGFASNAETRKAFSKLRSAIAGLYAYRKMYDDGETAFRQAIRLFPAAPEANFRLAKLYEDQGRLSDAIHTMTAYLKCALPDSREQVVEYMKQLEIQRQNKGTEPIR